jgi:hypothetical protein
MENEAFATNFKTVSLEIACTMTTAKRKGESPKKEAKKRNHRMMKKPNHSNQLIETMTIINQP